MTKLLKNPKKGDQCVTSTLEDTTLYEIKDITNGIASLSYKLGTRTVSGGELPIDMLLKPSVSQLN